MSNSIHCRICGYLPPEPPWGINGDAPTFEICPCCGVEWGYEDVSQTSADRFRQRWLAGGAPWQDKRTPQDGLGVQERLARLQLFDQPGALGAEAEGL